MLLLPLLLVLWADSARGLSTLPVLHSRPAGALLTVAGLLLWGVAAADLVWRGGGLPMNAYPPVRLVTAGAYGLLRHPLYTGFALAALGVVVWSGSPAGLWLVVPVLVLSQVALVVGHESPTLRDRFGPVGYAPRLRLPAAGDGRPDAWERASVYVLVLLPWLLGWSAVQLLGVPGDAFTTALPVDARIPVLEWTYAFYASCYLAVLLVPFVVQRRSVLRRFAVHGLLATALIVPAWLLLPAAYSPRSFTPHTMFGVLLQLDRAWCTGMAAFPSFHVVWAWLAAEAFAVQWPGARRAAWAWALLVSASCATTGMHGVFDIAAGLAAWLAVRSSARVWESLRAAAERVANSWHEWRFGPVRVINHGFYAGAACAVGVASLLLLAPGEPRAAALLMALSVIIGAGLWAQALESASGLLRPYGYYGGVFGALGVALAGPLFGYSGMLLLAALAVGAPWVQLLGRLRCLVQGCCHGRPASERVGIRYTHPRSRVAYLAGLAGRPLHPTPLYSMLANVAAGLFLLRLWLAGAPQALVVGCYLITNGLARFAEEGHRGEPQTPVVAGLRVYQWLAIAFVVAGAVMTTVSSPPAPPVQPPDAGVVWWMAVFALLGTVAMGVDFPESDRRFSRLAT